MKNVKNQAFEAIQSSRKKRMAGPQLVSLLRLGAEAANIMDQLPHLLFGQSVLVGLHVAGGSIADYHEHFTITRAVIPDFIR